VSQKENSQLDFLLFLYDQNGHVLYLSTDVPPYSNGEFNGKPGWEIMLPAYVKDYHSVLFRVLHGGGPEVFDAEFEHVGHWRLHLFGCHVGKARVIGMAEKIPLAVLELTGRQREICGHLALGRSSKEIAARLDVTRPTIDNHRAQIAERIGIEPRQLVAWCGEHRRWL
jgi:DNA-binding CsgD family transcriptional regulator